ncbi:Cell division cycle 20-1 cofactor of APC complex [Nymphaea thermarum]|nr:Cell division cycle 20-1 cofactor of APC complex [Nymphaea thermarum]
MVDSKKENTTRILTSSQKAYMKCLTEVCLKNRTRILAFGSKPLEPAENISWWPQRSWTVQPDRYISQTAEKILTALELMDDVYLNLLDSSSRNVLAIALGCSLYLWDASQGAACSKIMSVEDNDPITCVSWAANGTDIAIGLRNSTVQLWDATSSKQVYFSPVDSLAWNSHILTTGDMNGLIFNNDVRIPSHMVEEYKGHELEVCGLKWSCSGQQLDNGGDDKLLHIWDRTMALERNGRQNQWLHKLDDHRVLEYLYWILLELHGTGSQFCALLWSKTKGQLLSTHEIDWIDCDSKRALILWKYPINGYDGRASWSYFHGSIHGSGRILFSISTVPEGKAFRSTADLPRWVLSSIYITKVRGVGADAGAAHNKKLRCGGVARLVNRKIVRGEC